jgi:hypothetical protein
MPFVVVGIPSYLVAFENSAVVAVLVVADSIPFQPFVVVVVVVGVVVVVVVLVAVVVAFADVVVVNILLLLAYNFLVANVLPSFAGLAVVVHNIEEVGVAVHSLAVNNTNLA